MTDRRNFLKSMAALTATTLIPKDTYSQRDRIGELLPMRRLGKTGKSITMLGVGGSHVGRNDEYTAQAIIETAIENGVRFFDNAESYQNGRAEKYYGKFLSPKYRDVSFIMSKTTARDAKLAQKHLEQSLRNMNTDYLDLFQIHSVSSEYDVDARIKNGVLDYFLEAKAKGKVKHIGFTGHTSYKAHLRMLERTDQLETCQMPMNMFDPNYKSFIKNVLPVLIEQDYGVIAMKTLANGGFFGGTRHFSHGDERKIVPNYASIRDAIHFVWSLPVSVIVTGAEDSKMLMEKIELAKTFSGMEQANRNKLIAQVADFDGNKVEYYKS